MRVPLGSYLVSQPQLLLLVRDSHPDIHETTLVVPDLPVARLPYARCLVDCGPNFEEHAVALSEAPLGGTERAIIVRCLTAARPTTVSILWEAADSGGPLSLYSTERTSGSAAAATVAALRSDDLAVGEQRVVSLSPEGEQDATFSVSRVGRFFSVERS